MFEIDAAISDVHREDVGGGGSDCVPRISIETREGPSNHGVDMLDLCIGIERHKWGGQLGCKQILNPGHINNSAPNWLK